MAGDTSGSSRELDQTPTWAVASVCAVIIIISFTLEKALHKFGIWFTERHKRALFEALEKVKSELMVLGFISLLLTFGQSYIVRICIPAAAADTMLPCPADTQNDSSGSRRRLLSVFRRSLASSTTTYYCSKGYEPIISINGLHQIHILIFFLALLHVVYSAITMMLGKLKIRGWKKWEQETLSDDYEFSNDPSRFRLTHQTSFVRAHTSYWTKIPFFFYFGCFFRQFFRSVSKSDYTTLRNGFIAAHLAPGTKFDFQKYIKRSLEDDYKVVVGVSPVLWASFVIFLLINVNGWQALFWASLIPLIIILLVGTKLQAVLTKMAIEISERHAVVQGIPLVQGSDKYFWFGRPHLILHLIHFALFQNAFQITYFFWIWYSFGLKSCFHSNFKLIIVKIALGVGVLILCSYITLPLYALVTQMGSKMKKSIFDEQTSKALKKWHLTVKKKQGGKQESPIPSTLPSPGPALYRFKSNGHNSSRSYVQDEQEMTDLEADQSLDSLPRASTSNLIIEIDRHDDQVDTNEQKHGGESRNKDGVAFVKPAPVNDE